MSDPVSRLCVLGDGFAVAHPELVAIVVQTAASDWAASRPVAIERWRPPCSLIEAWKFPWGSKVLFRCGAFWIQSCAYLE